MSNGPESTDNGEAALPERSPSIDVNTYNLSPQERLLHERALTAANLENNPIDDLRIRTDFLGGVGIELWYITEVSDNQQVMKVIGVEFPPNETPIVSESWHKISDGVKAGEWNHTGASGEVRARIINTLLRAIDHSATST